MDGNLDMPDQQTLYILTVQPHNLQSSPHRIISPHNLALEQLIVRTVNHSSHSSHSSSFFCATTPLLPLFSPRPASSYPASTHPHFLIAFVTAARRRGARRPKTTHSQDDAQPPHVRPPALPTGRSLDSPGPNPPPACPGSTSCCCRRRRPAGPLQPHQLLLEPRKRSESCPPGRFSRQPQHDRG